MFVSTRSRSNDTRERGNERNDSINCSNDIDKTTRRAILLLIGKVLYIRLQKGIRKYGVVRDTFNEYHERYPWLSERQVRYALTKYEQCLNVSSKGESVQETDIDLPERINYDDTTNITNLRKVSNLQSHLLDDFIVISTMIDFETLICLNSL